MADEEKPKAAPQQTIEEEAGLPENWGVVNSQPVIPGRQNGGPVGSPPQTMTGIDNFQSGQLPPFLGLSPDLVQAGTPGPGVPTTRLMPIAPGGVSQIVAATKSVVQPIIDKAIAGIVIPPQTNASDGLTHGTTPWESDPGYIILRDDFHAGMNSNNIVGTIPTVSIGQLGWAFLGPGGGGQGGQMGGAPPNVGQYGWSNNGTASNAQWLTFAGSGGFSNSNYSQLGWALFDNPGWFASFVFKVDTGNPLSSSPKFSMAQTSMYVGFSGQAINLYVANQITRPDVFIGVRYDTSTTSPSINDSFFTLEVVANPTFTSPARNNTQGVTLVTNVVPVQGQWHRLDISCSAAGTVTLTLDGSSDNTLVTPIPVFSFTTTVGALSQNGAGRFSWAPSGSVPQSAWNTGTLLTASGFASSLVPFNTTWQLTASDESLVGFDTSLTLSGSQAGVMLSGYPSLIPIFMAGQDDTATPDSDDWLFVVDYFSLVWNPNLGPNAPGTPDATLSRYF